MVLSIRYRTIKKKRSGPYWISRNTYNFFCFNSSLSTKGTAYFFYISHYSVTEINPFHDENTTEQVNWYFSSAVVSSWKGLTFIIRVFFHDIAWKSSWKRLIYVFWTRYSVDIIVAEINICVVNTTYKSFPRWFPRYIVEHIFKRFNMPNINIYLECISFLKLYTPESLQSALSYMSQWSVEINYGTNR